MTPLRALCLAVLVVVVLIVVVGMAQARVASCAKHATMMEGLRDKHHEEVIGQGVSQDGRSLITITRSARGVFSVVLTRTNGVACIMQAGYGWTEYSPIYGQVPL